MAPGAPAARDPSAGSAFRNPPGDSAGRLIDAAGLKGLRIGGAAISEKHANFIVNDQKGTAADVRAVRNGPGTRSPGSSASSSRPEIELVGDWGTRRVTAPVPIVVLLGGPSAEHDVSVVSGTAIAEALASNGHAVEQILIDLNGRWWRLPEGHRREGREPAAYDDPPALGATGPETIGEALDRLRAPTRAGRVRRAPRAVRRGRHDPGAARGRGPRLHRIGRDRVGDRHGQGGLQAALRGIGLPIVDWIEVRASRWAGERAASWASSRRSRPGPATRG